MDALDLAKKFHQLYEQLAPAVGYETRPESRVEWSKVPDRNRRLMILVCEQILGELTHPFEVPGPCDQCEEVCGECGRPL